jgi:hypothetical protein
MKTMAACTVLLLLTAVAHSSEAQEAPVRAVDGLGEVARTVSGPDGPEILFDRVQCERVGPDVCQFTLLHESAHLDNDDVDDYAAMASVAGRRHAEALADCAAAGVASDDLVDAVVTYLRGGGYAGTSSIYGTSFARAARIHTCHYGEDAVPVRRSYAPSYEGSLPAPAPTPVWMWTPWGWQISSVPVYQY